MGLLTIQTNILAQNNWRNLKATGAKGAQASARLSSGYKINSAADDAAGLAISEKMRAQLRGLAQGTRNADDGMSLLQTADGALQEVHNILQRMRELAVQSCNDTNNDDDRVKLNEEFRQLATEINTIAEKTEFNKKKILDGTYARKIFDHMEGVLTSLTGKPNPVLLSYLRFFDIPGQTGVTESHLTNTTTLSPTTPTAPGVSVITPPGAAYSGTGADGPSPTVDTTNNANDITSAYANATHTGNSGKIDITADGATVENNAGEIRITGNGSTVEWNDGKVDIYGSGSTVRNLPNGSSYIIGSGNTVAWNEGKAFVNGNNTTVTTNAGGGEMTIYGDGATVGRNQSKIYIRGNGAKVTDLTHVGSETTIDGEDAYVRLNQGELVITGDRAVVDGNSGQASLTGAAAQIGTNSGQARLNGNGASITTNSGAAEFFGVSGNVYQNSGKATFSGTGSALVTTNSNAGDVYFGAGYTTAAVGVNAGTVESHARQIMITDNRAGGNVIMKDSTVAQVGTNSGKIYADSTNALLTVGNGQTGAIASPNGEVVSGAARTVITGNEMFGIVEITAGEVEIQRNAGSIILNAGVTVKQASAGQILTGQTPPHVITGGITTYGGTKLSSAAGRVQVGTSGTSTYGGLVLFAGAKEYVSVNHDSVIASGAGTEADIEGNTGTVRAEKGANAIVGVSAFGAYVEVDESTAAIGTNGGSLRLTHGSAVTVTTSTSRSRTSVSGGSGLTVTTNNGTVNVKDTSTVNVTTNTDTAELFLFENAAGTVGTNTGRIEAANVDVKLDVTNNEGYIRNFSTDMTVAANTNAGTGSIPNGVIDNYGIMNANCVSNPEYLRMHVTAKLPNGGADLTGQIIDGDISNGINVSGITPIATGNAMPLGAQTLEVYVNGAWRTLTATWTEKAMDGDCCIDADGMDRTGVNCADKIYELRFSGIADGGKITFDSNDAYQVNGLRYTIETPPEPDIPYDNANATSAAKSGFTLVYTVAVRETPVYTGNPGLWIQTGANSMQGTEVWTGDLHTNRIGIEGEVNQITRDRDPNNPELLAQRQIQSCDVYQVCECSTIAQARVDKWGHAERAINICDGAISQVSDIRALIGAQHNRIDAAGRSNDVSHENLSAAESRIRDADMAKEAVNQARTLVLNQAGLSMLAQSNQQAQSVLQLINK